MNIHAVSAIVAAPIHPGSEEAIESLFATQCRSAIENRTNFALNARLAMLSRLKATIRSPRKRHYPSSPHGFQET